jgi:hypothetical protein
VTAFVRGDADGRSSTNVLPSDSCSPSILILELPEPFLNAFDPVAVGVELCFDPASEAVVPLAPIPFLDGVGRCEGICLRPSPATFKC